jgi:site-specific DNA-methyltransferase (adenine-specific)
MGDLAFPWKPDFEEIYIFGEGWHGTRTSSVIFINVRTDSGRLHPTEKPAGLMSKFVGKSPNGLIVDPFMGSGTTLVAAKGYHRQAVGIELNERYCEIAANRLRQRVLPLEMA